MAETTDARESGGSVVASEYAGPMMATAGLAEAIDILKYNHAQALGVSVTDMMAMSFILQSGSTTPKAIGAFLQMSTGAVTALLDRLEAQRILARSANPDDRRSSLITLTPTGAKSISGDWVDFERRISRVAKSRTQAELDIITSFLSDLSVVLREK